MRDILEKYGQGYASNEERDQLEEAGLIAYYDGYHITYLGTVLLLKGRAKDEDIKELLDLSNEDYEDLLGQLAPLG